MQNAVDTSDVSVDLLRRKLHRFIGAQQEREKAICTVSSEGSHGSYSMNRHGEKSVHSFPRDIRVNGGASRGTYITLPLLLLCR